MQSNGANGRDRTSRVDRQLGIREEVSYLGEPGSRLLTMRHLPLADPRGGVVIAPSICSDFLRNYRREVLIARDLAGRGIAVQRFHYRGTGNSEGDPELTTFDDLCDDMRVVTVELVHALGALSMAFVGTRFGALVAATVARDWPTAPLALADPVVEARRFFREGFRARMAATVKAGEDAQLVTADLVAEVDETGAVDILGHTVHRALFHSAAEHRLTEPSPGARPVLCLQFGGNNGLRREYEHLCSTLREHGCSVEASVVGDQLAWWFIDEEDGMSFDAVPLVAAWVERQLLVTEEPT
ncbi:MAG: serine aminopeptidase domain-containing protein [Acidimicrobiales bacterium]